MASNPPHCIVKHAVDENGDPLVNGMTRCFQNLQVADKKEENYAATSSEAVIESYAVGSIGRPDHLHSSNQDCIGVGGTLFRTGFATSMLTTPAPLYLECISVRPDIISTGCQRLGSSGTFNGEIYQDAGFVGLYGGDYSQVFLNETILESIEATVRSLQNAADSLLGLAMERTGSMFLQDLTSQHTRYADAILDGVLPRIYDLMNDSSGCHLFRKLVQLQDQQKLYKIARRVLSEPNLLILTSFHNYGSFSLKVLIKGLANFPAILTLMEVFYPVFLQMMYNKTAAYVLLQCYESVDSQKCQQLYGLAIEHCLRLATHETGCIALNQSIGHIKCAKSRSKLLHFIARHSVFLSQDPRGNYVVQHVLQLEDPLFTRQIISMLQGHYASLSTTKAGSHVVEKCIVYGGLVYVVQELLEDKRFDRIAKHKFGNFVIQTALKEAMKVGDPIFYQLERKIQSIARELQYGYGKSIIKLLAQVVPLEQREQLVPQTQF